MDNFVLIFDDFVELAKRLKEYSFVHIFFDDKCDKVALDYILNLLVGTKVAKSYFPAVCASVSLADRIEFQEEDFVIALGGIQLQNLAKYYAYEYELDYAFVPMHEVAEYTFSKYAFVREKYYSFFECEKPKFVFCFEKFFSETDKTKLLQILKYKNIVLFEKEFEKDVFGEDRYVPDAICKCANLCGQDFKSIVKTFGMCASELAFSKPYDVLGSEYYVLSLFGSCNMVDSTICVQNTLAKLYDCVLKFPLASRNIDINMHLKFLKDFGVGVLEASQTISTIFDDAKLEEIKYRANAYFPYLQGLLGRATNNYAFLHINFDEQQMEKSLALCSGLFARKSIVRFLRDQGYFEDLLKN